MTRGEIEEIVQSTASQLGIAVRRVQWNEKGHFVRFDGKTLTLPDWDDQVEPDGMRVLIAQALLTRDQQLLMWLCVFLAAMSLFIVVTIIVISVYRIPLRLASPYLVAQNAAIVLLGIGLHSLRFLRFRRARAMLKERYPAAVEALGWELFYKGILRDPMTRPPFNRVDSTKFGRDYAAKGRTDLSELDEQSPTIEEGATDGRS